YIKSSVPVTLISIYDLNGRLIKLYNNIVNNEIDISELNSGVYLLKYKHGTTITTEKLIKN
ncbi:MAG: T9SS type A sorting domain-containing protein, partial [Bacteroidota bacterium]